VVSTALRAKDTTAPFVSSGAFGLVLHWPLFLPEAYLGTYPDPSNCTAPRPEALANLPVLWLPTAAKSTCVVYENWQVFGLAVWLLAGGAVTTTVRFPAEVLKV
jgi:hypothetical protein